MREWVITGFNKENVSMISQKFGLPTFLSLILETKKFNKDSDIEAFLSGHSEISNPFDLKDMNKATERINEAIDKFEKICIYGDYDADGVTSTAILCHYLESRGADVRYYLAQRSGKGYGMDEESVRKLAQDGINLIITVDNGITCIKEVEMAKTYGVDVIITDHHTQIKGKLPDAVAVIDPQREDDKSSFKYLAGVGVAFKLIMALEGDELDYETLIENYSEFVAIGTIADIVPLVGENRSLAKAGLKNLIQTDNTGLKFLMSAAGVNQSKINSTNVTYTIVPRINAAGRLGDAKRAVELLLSENEQRSKELADEIDNENIKRREIEAEIIKEIEGIIEKNPFICYDRVMVIEGDNFHKGVIGIVASRILYKYSKPCIIISKDGEESVASGRSIEGFSLYDAIYHCRDCFVKYGGHKLAVGFTIKTSEIKKFRAMINDYARENHFEMPNSVLNIDCKLNPSVLKLELAKELKALEPFGNKNEVPTVGIYGVIIEDITPLSNNKHLRLMLSKKGVKFTAMYFNMSGKDFLYNKGDVIDLAANLNENEYNGIESLSIVIKDTKINGIDYVDYFKSIKLFESNKKKEEYNFYAIKGYMPKREEFATIYRYIKGNDVKRFRLDILSIRIKEKMPMLKIMLILLVFDELGIVEIKEFKNDLFYIDIKDIKEKIDLYKSNLMNKLNKYEIEDGE